MFIHWFDVLKIAAAGSIYDVMLVTAAMFNISPPQSCWVFQGKRLTNANGTPMCDAERRTGQGGVGVWEHTGASTGDVWGCVIGCKG